jgi:hypothetical protein
MVEIDPNLYRLSLYDWWVIESTAREVLSMHEYRQYLQSYREVSRAIKSVLHQLNVYDFRDVESDIWREVYQHYMPKGERLRLGGFYTDDELAALLLELVGYAGEELLDPACGSGTFLVEAVPFVRRRVEQQIRTRSRSARAKEILEVVSSSIKGIDIHPFAVFLSRMNLFFITLDLFQSIRNMDPQYTYRFPVYEADYLERPMAERPPQLRMSLFMQNSRAKEAMEQRTQADAIKAHPVKIVVGNPPWGGVLRPGRPLAKGIAGGGTKSRSYASEYASARGKYDIYVLFLERGLEQIEVDGTLAFVTQNRYLSRDYAKAIRKLLVQKSESEARSVRLIVDLGEVGGIFFFPEQTNYPCLTIVQKSDLPTAKLVKVESEGLLSISPEAKQQFINGIKRVCQRLDEEKQASYTLESGISIAGIVVEQETLRQWAQDEVAWELSKPAAVAIQARRRKPVASVPVTEAFIVQQGATTGRADRILLMTKEVAYEQQLEEGMLRKVLRGRDITPFHITWPGLVAIYPYDARGKSLNLGKGIWEGSAARARERIHELIALGQVREPRCALYLAQFYDELANRIFKGRNIREFSREWYEWLWPRKPELVLATPKIVSRRQIHESCFAIDTEGCLVMDSCLALVPHRDSDGWDKLLEYFRAILGREPQEIEILRFVVAIVNHPIYDRLLKKGGTPQRGNYYSIGEEHLSRLHIPLPTQTRLRPMVRRLASGKSTDASNILP